MPGESFETLWMILTFAFIPVAAWLFVQDRRRCRQVVDGWAYANDVVLVRRLPAWYRLSPFVLATLFGGKQKIEYWLVRDSVGLEHRVWLKIGSFWRGATTDIEDEWES